MERKRKFFNQKFVCGSCGKEYEGPVNFCADCGKVMSEAGKNLEIIKKKNDQLEVLIRLIDCVKDVETLELIKKMVLQLKQ